MSDIVVDTNVFAHTADPHGGEYENSVGFLAALVTSAISLSVDEGFSMVESLNRSRIVSEYLTRIQPGCLGHAVLSQMASTERVRSMRSQVPPACARVINDAVWDVSDRVFVKVARNSTRRLLVTNDRNNFPTQARKKLSDVEIDVQDPEQGLVERLGTAGSDSPIVDVEPAPEG